LQIAAGAQAICVCEPAYNTVYISPREMERDPAILQKLVIGPNLRIKDVMQRRGVELIFHDCGELNEAIIRSMAQLDPAILSLGSPCDLPSIAALIPQRTVIMGNLPSKKFYSDQEITVDQVMQQGRKLLEAMEATGHPFILGTECDVLCVEGCTETIHRKAIAVTQACVDSSGLGPVWLGRKRDIPRCVLAK
jgi:uroporphyrinogen-III decarboxylase